MMLSSPLGSLAALGGVSCRFFGGALVVGAGGGDALFSAVFLDSSAPRRCCSSRVPPSSRFTPTSVSFLRHPEFHGLDPILFDTLYFFS